MIKEFQQLTEIKMKVVESIPFFHDTITINRQTFINIITQIKQIRSYFHQVKGLQENFQRIIHFFSREIEDAFAKMTEEYFMQLRQKDNQIQSLKRNLQQSKKRNSEFIKMIEQEFAKKDEITLELTESIKELKQRNNELEEIQEQKNNQFKEYKQIMQKILKQNQVQRKESRQYIGILQKQISDIKVKYAQYNLIKNNNEYKIESSKSKNQLEVINEVTQTCLTTEKQEQDYEQIEKKYNKIDDNRKQYDFRQDLEIVKKFSSDIHKNKQNLFGPVNKIPKKHTNFIKKFRNNLQCLETKTIQVSQINNNQKNKKSSTKIKQQISAEFPISSTLLLLPLNQVTPNSSNERQSYVGNYHYQGTFDQDCQRSGYGVLRKNDKIIYSGDWKKGVFDGWGKLNLENQKFKQYTGGFKNGFFSGRGNLIYSNGDKYIGEISGDSIQGEGTYYKNNSQIIFGVWEKNILKSSY